MTQSHYIKLKNDLITLPESKSNSILYVIICDCVICVIYIDHSVEKTHGLLYRGMDVMQKGK